MKLPYELQQFWIRRLMWRWCFDWWFRVMYPHIYYSEYGEKYEEYMGADDMWWFWDYLNNCSSRVIFDDDEK